MYDIIHRYYFTDILLIFWDHLSVCYAHFTNTTVHNNFIDACLCEHLQTNHTIGRQKGTFSDALPGQYILSNSLQVLLILNSSDT